MNVDLISEVAKQLGAERVPFMPIIKAWHEATRKSRAGILMTIEGKRLFIRNRLNELGCFSVGCSTKEIRLCCQLHWMEPSQWTNADADAFTAIFVRGAGIAATKTDSLKDSEPVNETTRRAHKFRGKKK